jgi:hypothetical protein
MRSVTRFTVEREIRRGNLTAEKVSGRWLIAEAEAERWAAGFVPYREQRERGLDVQPETKTDTRGIIRGLPPMR